MKSKLILWIVTLIITCSVGCNLRDLGLVALPEIEQEKTNWCWAASMQAVLQVYGTTVTQCQEANWLFARTDCCSPANCNWTASGQDQKDILDHWGLSSTLISSTLTWNQLKAEIDAGRPINIGFQWCPIGSGGHSLDIYGFSELDGTPITRNVGYMDPWFGEGYSVADYDWMVGGCPGDHTWYRTIYNIH